MVCMSYPQHVDIHKMAEEVQPMWTHMYGRVWSTTLIFVDVINGWPLVGFNSESVGLSFSFEVKSLPWLRTLIKLLALASGLPALASGVLALALGVLQ